MLRHIACFGCQPNRGCQPNGAASGYRPAAGRTFLKSCGATPASPQQWAAAARLGNCARSAARLKSTDRSGQDAAAAGAGAAAAVCSWGPVPQLDRAFGMISQRLASLPAQGLTQRRGRPTQNQEAGQGRRQLHTHLAGKMLPCAGRPGPPAAPGAPLPAARHPYCSGPLLGVFDRFPGCLCRSGRTLNQRERQGRRVSWAAKWQWSWMSGCERGSVPCCSNVDPTLLDALRFTDTPPRPPYTALQLGTVSQGPCWHPATYKTLQNYKASDPSLRSAPPLSSQLPPPAAAGRCSSVPCPPLRAPLQPGRGAAGL